MQRSDMKWQVSRKLYSFISQAASRFQPHNTLKCGLGDYLGSTENSVNTFGAVKGVELLRTFLGGLGYVFCSQCFLTRDRYGWASILACGKNINPCRNWGTNTNPKAFRLSKRENACRTL